MNTSFSSADIKEFLSFPFKDEKWGSKLLIATLLAFFGFLIFPIFLLSGYIYEIMRRMIVERESPSLPEWDAWGDYLVNGFRVWVAGIVYSLPTLLFMLPYIAMMFIMPWLTESSGPNVLPVVMMFFSFGLMGIGMAVSIVAWIFFVPALGHMAAKDELKAAFRIKEFWPVLRNNLVGYLLSFIIYLGLMYVVMFVSQIFVLTVVLCVLYPVVLTVSTTYLYLVTGALFAHAYVEGVENTAVKESALLEESTAE